MNKRTRCSLCDEWFDPLDSERVKVHEHPEPQGGEWRTEWLNSGLDYDTWTETTKLGQIWEKKQNEQKKM